MKNLFVLLLLCGEFVVGVARADLMNVVLDRTDAKYLGSEKIGMTVIVAAQPQNSDQRVAVDAVLPTDPIRTENFTHRSGRTFFYRSPKVDTLDAQLTGQAPIKLIAYFENGKVVDSYRKTLKDLDLQIVDLTTQVENGAGWEIQRKLNEAIRLKASLEARLATYRTKIGERDISAHHIDERQSDGVLSFSGVDRIALNSKSSVLRVSFNGAHFEKDTDLVLGTINGALLSKSRLSFSGEDLLISGPWEEGSNVVELSVTDEKGKTAFNSIGFYAGDVILTVYAKDENGNAIADAVVDVTVGADISVHSTLITNPIGQAIFTNFPAQSLIVSGSKGALFGEAKVAGATGAINLVLKGMDSSVTPNLDFSNGTDGWTSDGTLTVIDGSSKANVPDPNDPARSRTEITAKQTLNAEGVGPLSTCPYSKCDLQLKTSGAGVKRATHTFTSSGGFMNIKYRFQTNEFPTYYGPEYNYDDAYSVTVRKNGLVVFKDSRSLKSFAAGAYSTTGFTAWMNGSFFTMPNDDIQIELSVANVGDGLVDSRIIVERIESSSLAITALDYKNIDGGPLKYLSVGPHPYFGGKTLIDANLVIQGEPGDRVQTIGVEVLQEGVVKATATAVDVSPELKALIGSGGTVSGRVRFPISMTGTSFGDQSVVLRTYATSVSSGGSQAVSRPLDYPILKNIGSLFSTNERYFERNESEGGDDWSEPAVKSYIEKVVKNFDFKLGDISKMNGGPLAPHAMHSQGKDADFSNYAKFYLKEDATPEQKLISANTIVSIANDPTLVDKINVIFCEIRNFVPGSPDQTDPFWKAIYADPVAKAKVGPLKDHDGHFHIQFK